MAPDIPAGAASIATRYAATPATTSVQRSHGTVGAQHRIRQLAQLIRPGGQAGTELPPEPRQHGGWPTAGILWQTAITAFVRGHCPWREHMIMRRPYSAARHAAHNGSRSAKRLGVIT
jgi:hypothetical protein